MEGLHPPGIFNSNEKRILPSAAIRNRIHFADWPVYCRFSPSIIRETLIIGVMGQSGQTRCDKHGNGFETFACEHLVENLRQRWFSAEPCDENPWPNAWCRVCNVHFEKYGEWNSVNSGSLRAVLLCHECYESPRMQGIG